MESGINSNASLPFVLVFLTRVLCLYITFMYGYIAKMLFSYSDSDNCILTLLWSFSRNFHETLEISTQLNHEDSASQYTHYNYHLTVATHFKENFSLAIQSQALEHNTFPIITIITLITRLSHSYRCRQVTTSFILIHCVHHHSFLLTHCIMIHWALVGLVGLAMASQGLMVICGNLYSCSARAFCNLPMDD